MKRLGVIHSLNLDIVRFHESTPEVRSSFIGEAEKARQSLAKTFPGVRFMVTPYGSSAVFEFDDEDEPLLDRILPMPEFIVGEDIPVGDVVAPDA
jgi:hypothetical protein